MSAVTEVVRALYLGLHGAGWVVAYTLIIGLAVGGAVAFALHLMRGRGAWARYALCCGALVLMIGLPLKVGLSIADAYEGHHAFADGIATELLADRTWPSELALMQEMEVRHDGSETAWISSAAASRLGTGLALVGTLWLLVAIALLTGVVREWRHAIALRERDVRPVSERWSRMMKTVRRRVHVGQPVALAVSPHVSGPALVGWHRPVILLPPTVHDLLTDAEAEAVLAHELAHIRRGDFAVNVLQTAVEAVLFFHPVVHWLGRRLRDEREFCSDDVAHRSIGGTLTDYLRALATLESLRTESAPEPALGADGGSLFRRIRRLAEMERDGVRPRFDLDAMLVLLCLLVIWLPTLEVSARMRPAAITVMKHELFLPRDFDRLAPDGVPAHHVAPAVGRDR